MFDSLPSGRGFTDEQIGLLLGAAQCLMRVQVMLNLNLGRMPADDAVLAKNYTDALNDIAANTPEAGDSIWEWLAGIDSKRGLTAGERKRVIEDARAELPELDRRVEEGLSRLRELAGDGPDPGQDVELEGTEPLTDEEIRALLSWKTDPLAADPNHYEATPALIESAFAKLRARLAGEDG